MDDLDLDDLDPKRLTMAISDELVKFLISKGREVRKIAY